MKSEIRDQVRSKKRAMSLTDITEFSKMIEALLYKTKEYQQADAIYTYVSYNQEVITHDLIKKAIKDGKKVAVPKVCGEKIEFYYIESLKELTSGYQHILEPTTTKKADPKSEKWPLMILPGLAFDKSGNRIGYGGGFYDRYLKEYRKTFCRCAIGFAFQLYDHFETESFDVSVNMVITQNAVYHAEGLHSNAERVDGTWNI